MLQVICPMFSKNEDVIQIYDHKRIGERSKDIVHQSHEVSNNVAPTTIQHRVAQPGSRSPRQPAMSPDLQYQALQG